MNAEAIAKRLAVLDPNDFYCGDGTKVSRALLVAIEALKVIAESIDTCDSELAREALAKIRGKKP